MQTQYRLIVSARDGSVRRVAAPASVPSRPVLTHLSLTVALRVALALLLYILKLRLDSQMLSPKRARQIRADILHLFQGMTAIDPDAPAEAPRPAIAIAPVAPLPSHTVRRIAPPIKPLPAPLPTAVKPPSAPSPAPYVRSLAEAPANSIVLDDMSQESLAELSLSELREFARVAARDTKPMFEQALLAAYRKQLIAMFCGAFSVKQETDDFNYPEFRLICRGAKTVVLKRAGATGASTPHNAYEMLRECWQAQKRPQHFRVEQESGEFARELLSCATGIKN